jgi:predicted enzyme related to lactoylglutathione lyase
MGFRILTGDKMDNSKPATGAISWIDLTVDGAEAARDFYREVIGWKSDPVSMGEYDDYCMIGAGSNAPVAGICHARGVNADLPAQWLVYITVANLDQSIAACEGAGGEIIAGPKNMGNSGRYCVVKDPAGAVAALYEQKGDVDLPHDK